MVTLKAIPLVTTAGALLLCFSSPIPAQTDNPMQLRHSLARHFEAKPPVRFEIEKESEFGARIIVTNREQSPLTAYVVQTVPISTDERAQTVVCDALTRVRLLAPIPRGLSHMTGIPRRVDRPVPDATLVAAVWEDGSTFGPDDVLHQISSGRMAFAGDLDRAVAMLQNGLGKNWTAQEYVAAAGALRPEGSYPALGKPTEELSFSVWSNILVRTITSNMDLATNDGRPAARTAQVLLDFFAEERDALRQALEGPTTSPNSVTK
jgi:hypothetical protein